MTKHWSCCLAVILLLLAAPLAVAESTTLEDPGVALVGLGDLFTPAPEARACSASFECGDGNVAACTGSYSCHSYPLAVPPHVTCDGQDHHCPNMCYVQVFCSPSGWIQCASNVGDCQTGSNWVECDGNYFECGQRGGPD